MDVSQFAEEMELFQLGAVNSLAFNEPQKLREVDPRKIRSSDLQMDMLPLMLRIPQKNRSSGE